MERNDGLLECSDVDEFEKSNVAKPNIRGVVFGTGNSDTEALESLSEWSLNGTSLSLVTVENSVTREILAQNVPW